MLGQHSAGSGYRGGGIACRQWIALGMEVPDVKGNSDMETPPIPR